MSNRLARAGLQCLAMLLALQASAFGALHAQVTFTVNDVGDAGDGTCDVTCTLRDAITEANATVGANDIEFDIPGLGPHVIAPATELPAITEEVTIDGTSQPAGQVVLDGTSAGANTNGLTVTTGPAEIRGLVIQNFATGAGIALSSGGNTVAQNRIGTDVAGTSAAGNFFGVRIDAGSGNTIGGNSGSERNIISGNLQDGVHITGTASGTIIRRNYIGLDANGTSALGNQRNGVRIDGSADNRVGADNHGNVISSNAEDGVHITGAGSTGNHVLANIIGTDKDLSAVKLGNGHNNGGSPKFSGVHVTGGASTTRVGWNASGEGNVIGDSFLHGVLIDGNGSPNIVRGNMIGTTDGTTHFGNRNNGVHVEASSVAVGGVNPGDANTIAFQGRDGVVVVSPANNVSILRNSIYENATVNGGTPPFLGIDLENDGITPNDPLDVDHGDSANRLQNFPVLTSAVGTGNIVGSLNSLASSTFTLEFFANPMCDPSGNGEGKFFLGTDDVTTDGSGDADFTFNYGALTAGFFVTATATTQMSQTSEFSACVEVESGADVEVTKDGPATVDSNQQFDYTITVTNNGPGEATDVDITDVLPAEVTFVSATDGGVESGGTVTWPTVASIANGADVMRTVTVTAPESGTLDNVASATSSSIDPDDTNNDGSNAGAQVSTTVTIPPADVEVAKAGPATVDAGMQVLYTITVTNNGPADAEDVVITDVLPAGVTFVSASDGGSNNSGTVTWPAVGILNGNNVVRTVTVTAPPTGTLENVASAAATTPDLDPTNNDGSNAEAKVTTVVGEAADVTVEKSGPPTVGVGGEITYTITVTNDGPSTAEDIVISDVLPGAATFVSASDGGTESGGTVTWPAIASLNDAVSVERTVVVTAPATEQTLDNVASATASTNDPDETNNDGTNAEAQVSTVVGPEADISVAKTGPGTVDSGATMTYTLTVTNNGPSDAQDVVISDVLPGTVTFVSASNFGNEAGGTVTWPAVPLGNGESVERSVTVTAPATGTLENVAQATAATGDADPTNNDGSNAGARVTTTVNPLADVEVTKTGPAAVDAMEQYSYTLSVVNNGPAAAENVVITDQLPSEVSFVSASDGGLESGGAVTFPTISVTVGQTVQRTVTVTAPASGSFMNVASATADTDDPAPSNNDGTNAGAQVTTTIGGFTVAVAPTTASVLRGSDATYTVTVAPAATTFPDPVDLTCADLPAGTMCSFNPATVTPGADGATSTLTVSTEAPTTPTGVSAFTVTGTATALTVDAAANLDVTTDFALSVTPGSATIDIGGTAMYTLTVEDSGYFDQAVSFACSDLPAGASCTFSPSAVTPNGTDQTVQLGVTANATSAGLTLPDGSSDAPWWIWAVLALVGLPLGIAQLRGSGVRTAGGRRRLSMAFAVILLGCVTVLAACSDDGPMVPNEVTETFTITGTAGAVEHSTTAQITIRM